MSFDPETARIVRSWLKVDEHESADRVLRHVLDQLATTPQRRAGWPARRMPEMNSAIKLALGAAAIVVASLVGFNLLGSGSTPGIGGPAASPSADPSPSPSPRPSPSPSPSPSPTPMAWDYPRSTDLEPGTRYRWVVDGVPLSLAVPAAGWSTKGTPWGTMSKDAAAGPEGSATGSWLLVWDVENVNTSPCSTAALDPMPGPSAADLAAAVASIPGIEMIMGPTDVTVGGRPAIHLTIALPDDLGCDPQSFELWYSTGHPSCDGTGECWRWASEPGQTIDIWIIEADGGRIFFEAETYKASSPDLGGEIQQIVDSIQFE